MGAYQARIMPSRHYEDRSLRSSNENSISRHIHNLMPTKYHWSRSNRITNSVFKNVFDRENPDRIIDLKHYEFKRHKLVRDVEAFVVFIYDNFNRRESLRLLLESELAVDYFRKFAKVDNSLPYLDMCTYIIRIIKNDIKLMNYLSLLEYLQKLQNDHFSASSPLTTAFQASANEICLIIYDLESCISPSSPSVSSKQSASISIISRLNPFTRHNSPKNNNNDSSMLSRIANDLHNRFSRPASRQSSRQNSPRSNRKSYFSKFSNDMSLLLSRPGSRKYNNFDPIPGALSRSGSKEALDGLGELLDHEVKPIKEENMTSTKFSLSDSLDEMFSPLLKLKPSGKYTTQESNASIVSEKGVYSMKYIPGSFKMNMSTADKKSNDSSSINSANGSGKPYLSNNSTNNPSYKQSLSSSKYNSGKLLNSLTQSSKVLSNLAISLRNKIISDNLQETNRLNTRSRSKKRQNSGFRMALQKHLSGNFHSLSKDNEKMVLSPEYHADIAAGLSVNERALNILTRLRDLCVDHLSGDMFKRYMSSRHYSLWRSQEAAVAVAGSIPDYDDHKPSSNQSNPSTIRRNSIQNTTSSIVSTANYIRRNSGTAVDKIIPTSSFYKAFGSSKNSSRTNTLRNSNRTSKKTSDFSQSATSSVDRVDAMVLLSLGSWIASLISISEGLSVGVIIMSATRNEFPISYANRSFLNSMQCTIDNVLGIPCKEVLCNIDDVDMANQLSTHLDNQHTGVLNIKYQNIAGVTVNNHIALRPVFDEDQSYIFVIALVVNDLTEGLWKNDITGNLTKAMKLLPSTILD